MTAAEIMTTRVVSIRATENVARAVEVLGELDVRHLPVVENGELVGMLSDRDLRGLGVFEPHDGEALQRSRALRNTALSEVMSADVVSVDPATSVRDLIDTMVAEKVGAVPVVDAHTGSVVGIVSYIDVLRAAARLLDE
jgi:acetoin utilization protein AcuB